ncbi:hypothetical protein BDV09DRAFT_157069 [Aspergillus tetrazonus]
MSEAAAISTAVLLRATFCSDTETRIRHWTTGRLVQFESRCAEVRCLQSRLVGVPKRSWSARWPELLLMPSPAERGRIVNERSSWPTRADIKRSGLRLLPIMKGLIVLCVVLPVNITRSGP